MNGRATPPQQLQDTVIVYPTAAEPQWLRASRLMRSDPPNTMCAVLLMPPMFRAALLTRVVIRSIVSAHSDAVAQTLGCCCRQRLTQLLPARRAAICSFARLWFSTCCASAGGTGGRCAGRCRSCPASLTDAQRNPRQQHPSQSLSALRAVATAGYTELLTLLCSHSIDQLPHDQLPRQSAAACLPGLRQIGAACELEVTKCSCATGRHVCHLRVFALPDSLSISLGMLR